MKGKKKSIPFSDNDLPIYEITFDEVVVFLIKKINFTSKTFKENEKPHRHNFQEIMLLQEARGHHFIDNKMVELKPNTFYLIAQGQVHYFLDDVGASGILIRFTDDFLFTDDRFVGSNSQLTLINLFSSCRIISIEGDQLALYVTFLENMLLEYTKRKYAWVQVLRNSLSILLIFLERSLSREASSCLDMSASNKMHRSFIRQLEKDYKKQHEVAYYSQSMNLSVRQLSNIVRKITGNTAKNIILERITIEAKRYLQHTNASIKEISYNLGFKDPSYFIKTFKQMTGISPGNFRDTNSNLK